MTELNSEDYENIWLRTKDRFLKWYLWILVFFSVASAIFGVTIAKIFIEPEIERYIESDPFKKRVSAHLLERLPELENRVMLARQNIDDLLESMSAIQGLPFEINTGLISLLDKNGERVIIQYGTMSEGTVTFPVAYSEQPIVLVTNVGVFSARTAAAVVEVTPAGFSVPFSSSGRSINWVAVGR